MIRTDLDLGVYLVTDPEMTAQRGLAATVREAVAGGVSMVQLRDKHASDAALIEIARALKRVLAGTGVPLIINDRLAVAQLVGAEGVHLGQDDIAPELARARLGPRAIIGLSVSTRAEIARVDPTFVDYAGLGPIFATSTKRDAGKALGDARFAALRKHIPVPVVAIGGVTLDNASRAFAAGADGVAVVGAICAAADPQAAARRLAEIARAARGRTR